MTFEDDLKEIENIKALETTIDEKRKIRDEIKLENEDLLVFVSKITNEFNNIRNIVENINANIGFSFFVHNKGFFRQINNSKLLRNSRRRRFEN